jgi:hypothetical protein
MLREKDPGALAGDRGVLLFRYLPKRGTLMPYNIITQIPNIKGGTVVGPDPIFAKHVAAIHKLLNRTILDIVELGCRFTECKQIVGHSRWLLWLEQEFGINSERLVQIWMQVYERSKSEKFSDLMKLDLPPSAFYLLSAPTEIESIADDDATASDGAPAAKPRTRRSAEQIQKDKAGNAASLSCTIILTALGANFSDVLVDCFLAKHIDDLVDIARNPKLNTIAAAVMAKLGGNEPALDRESEADLDVQTFASGGLR